jgi:hypothetical protein
LKTVRGAFYGQNAGGGNVWVQVLPAWHQASPYPQGDVSLQVYDFSPVIGIFHVFSRIFHPISQSQGFDFSPVTRNAWDK